MDSQAAAGSGCYSVSFAHFFDRIAGVLGVVGATSLISVGMCPAALLVEKSESRRASRLRFHHNLSGFQEQSDDTPTLDSEQEHPKTYKCMHSDPPESATILTDQCGCSLFRSPCRPGPPLPVPSFISLLSSLTVMYPCAWPSLVPEPRFSTRLDSIGTRIKWNRRNGIS